MGKSYRHKRDFCASGKSYCFAKVMSFFVSSALFLCFFLSHWACSLAVSKVIGNCLDKCIIARAALSRKDIL